MNILTQTAKIYRHNVGYLYVTSTTGSGSLSTSLPPLTPIISRRYLTTNQWKKYLNVLDINKDASTKDIKDSFLKLSKVYHPDNKTTGSHTKFVELKEAYDALKDGKPTITTHSSANTYHNYYDDDISYEAHKNYRDRYKTYTYDQSTDHGFGGPYRHSRTPWEDLSRDREYQRQKERYNKRPHGSSLMNVTVVLSAMAWVVIYSCVLLIWDAPFKMSDYKARNQAEYLQYKDYLRRKEAMRKSRAEVINNPRFEVEDPPNDIKTQSKVYITTNNQRVLTPVAAIKASKMAAEPRSSSTESKSPPPLTTKSAPVNVTPSALEDSPEVVVGAL